MTVKNNSDIGIQLSLKDDSYDHTVDDVIDAINKAVAQFGYRCSRWSTWEKFILSCHEQYLYTEDLYKKLEGN